jgi:hypothetical protein
MCGRNVLFIREEKLNVCYGQISLKFDVCSDAPSLLPLHAAVGSGRRTYSYRFKPWRKLPV